MNIVGQKNLIAKLKSYSINTLPQSILLIGEKGSGKTTIANYIAKEFNLDVSDLTEDIDLRSNTYISAIPYLYLIDLNNINEKNQNKLLKLVEEPSPNSYLVLMSNNENNVLETIRNRCSIFYLDEYTTEELSSFTTNDKLDLSIFRTPGQLLSFNYNILNNLLDLAEKLIFKIEVSSFPNTLTISDKFNYSDEYDKLDLDVFLNRVMNRLKEIYIDNTDVRYYNYYMLTVELKNKLTDSRFNKKHLVENYLTKLWKESRR